MNKVDRNKLKILINICNVVKFSAGIPLLIVVSLRFMSEFVKIYVKLYVAVTLKPYEVKSCATRIKKLSAGFKNLWAPNTLNEHEEEN